ncbi:MAG: NAD(P)-dependent oxidoreductase [Rhodanobacteraceae bacterium]|nr:NAD(P)-dependent oxidoreductase [Rhodanobacteraceae bacterium]
MGQNLLSVFDALEQAGFSGRLTWFGSSMMYGRAPIPRRVTNHLQPETFRGAIKAAESILAQQRADELGIAYTELRLFTGYGPLRTARPPCTTSTAQGRARRHTGSVGEAKQYATGSISTILRARCCCSASPFMFGSCLQSLRWSPEHGRRGRANSGGHHRPSTDQPAAV